MQAKDWIELKGLTVKQFAIMLGVSESTAWRIVNGKHLARPATQRRVEKVTGGAVQPNDLVGGLK